MTCHTVTLSHSPDTDLVTSLARHCVCTIMWSVFIVSVCTVSSVVGMRGVTQYGDAWDTTENGDRQAIVRADTFHDFPDYIVPFTLINTNQRSFFQNPAKSTNRRRFKPRNRQNPTRKQFTARKRQEPLPVPENCSQDIQINTKEDCSKTSNLKRFFLLQRLFMKVLYLW